MNSTGITDETLLQNPKLSNAINVLAYNTDRNGEKYIAIYEAKLYPFYATQFHPEAVAVGSSNNSRIPSSPAAKDLAKSLAEFFVEEASCSGHGNRTLVSPLMLVRPVSNLAVKVCVVAEWNAFRSFFMIRHR